MTFRVGQEVVCVNDNSSGLVVPLPFSLGRHYTVFARYGRYVALVGVRGKWSSKRFRAPRKTDISVFEVLLNTKSEKELV